MRPGREEIEMGYRQKQRHDQIQRHAKAGRGWSGLAVVMEPAQDDNQEIQSASSE